MYQSSCVKGTCTVGVLMWKSTLTMSSSVYNNAYKMLIKNTETETCTVCMSGARKMGPTRDCICARTCDVQQDWAVWNTHMQWMVSAVSMPTKSNWHAGKC